MSDNVTLNYMYRIAKFYAHHATHRKLEVNVEDPVYTFISYGSFLVDYVLKHKSYPEFTSTGCAEFSVAAKLLRDSGTLKDAVAFLYKEKGLK